MNTSPNTTFDIRNFSENLTPTKNKDRYICPACGGNNLTINPKNGKYKCWNECECKEIRDVIAPWNEMSGDRQQIPRPQRSSKPSSPTPAPIPDGAIELAKLPNQVSSPARVQKGYQTEIIYPYSPTQWVVRVEDPEGKATYPYHIGTDGKPTKSKGGTVWSPYRMDEVRTHGIGKWVLGVEGEKCVEAARQLSLVSFTLQGASWGEVSLNQAMQLIKDAGVLGVVYFPDNDTTGYSKAEKLAAAAASFGLPFIQIDPVRLWAECPKKGDIADWVELSMSTEEFLRRIEEEIKASIEEKRRQLEVIYTVDTVSPDDEVNPNVTFLQKAVNFLYGDKRWICADQKLYYHTGTYYKERPDSIERPRIANFCNSFKVINDKNEISYPFAKPSKVREILQWAKDRFEINPELLNPPGINCTNGVIKVELISNVPTHSLYPHTPDDYFIYEPLVEYNPEADPVECERLLSCLDKPQQEILLRTLAASIDIETIRKFRGREIRVLLASGLGSNGKDSLREVVSTILGHSGMTSISLADFATYDDGRKFALAPLMNSRVNWASENPQTARLDKIQSLKLFATGNKLHCERKGKDHIEFTPSAIGIFNVNEPPSLQGTMQAIQDRIAVLEFLKTFKLNPDPNNPNELKADPRFAYDPEFVRTKVAPAFLNKMLLALPILAAEGIDYECTSDAFRSMQKENNHLFQFLEDTNIGYKPDGTMSAKELWSFLEKWYIDNGTLTLEDDGKRRTWIDQVKPSDKNVKGINQIIPRIMALFPKAEKATRYDETAKRNVPIIKGIGIIENTRTTVENNRTSSAPVSALLTTQNQDFRTTCTTFINEEESEKKIDDEPLCPFFVKPPGEDYPPESGASGAEPSDTNTCNQQQWCESGATQLESGAGNDDVAVLGSAQLIAEALVQMDGEVIEALARHWSDDFKQAVKSQLSLSDRKAVESLAPGVLPILSTKIKPSNSHSTTSPINHHPQAHIPQGWKPFQNELVTDVMDKSRLRGEKEKIINSIPDNLSLTQKMIQAWDNRTALGSMVLGASTDELRKEVDHYTTEQIAHIKEAANTVWKPGLDRDAEYSGERVEIIEADNTSRSVVIKYKSGSKTKVKRGNLKPWLGI